MAQRTAIRATRRSASIGSSPANLAAPKALADLFTLVLQPGGTLNKGSGQTSLRFVKDALDPGALSLMRAIKAQFDPHGILNSGKVLP